MRYNYKWILFIHAWILGTMKNVPLYHNRLGWDGKWPPSNNAKWLKNYWRWDVVVEVLILER